MAPNNAARGVCLSCAAAAGLWGLVVGYRSPSTGGAVFGHGGGDSDGGSGGKKRAKRGSTMRRMLGGLGQQLLGSSKKG